MRRTLQVLCCVLAAVLAGTAGAALRIEITRGHESATPIAVARFGWSGAGAAAPPEPVWEIVAADLARSGRFAPVDDLPQHPVRQEDVRWADWRRLKIASLVFGSIEEAPPPADGVAQEYVLEFRLVDTFTRGTLAGRRYEGVRADQLRWAAHRISDEVYSALTGEAGAFATRIAYVTEDAGQEGRTDYSLNVADSDGANPFEVWSSPEPIMSPAWSPDGQRLAYVSFEQGRSQIFVQHLATGERRAVSGFSGINGAPAFSPDGGRLALTLSRGGDPEIYVLDLESGGFRRLTRHPGIDTEPSWSPDGRSIVFTSNRSGRPQLYLVPVRGEGKPERLTFSGDYNARAAFSPDGSRLVFIHGNRGHYRIAVMGVEEREIVALTRGGLDESPAFAPNGRMILYATSEGGRSSLAAVSIDGGFRQKLLIEGAKVRDPAWSPYESGR